MTEFEAIEWLINELGDLWNHESVVTGPGDDAAILSVPAEHELAVSTDTLVAGVHFPEGTNADLIAYRAIAINVSDMASMGAKPLAVTVAMTLESIEQSWLELFVEGLRVAASEYEVCLIGGNIAKGPLNITVTIHGSIPRGSSLLRSNAQLHDDIWLTGTIGATQIFLKGGGLEPREQVSELAELRDLRPFARYFMPHARSKFATAVREHVNAAIDISDGLVADLMHVIRASELGAEIELNRVATWSGVSVVDAASRDDSYELLFTANPSERTAVLDVASSLSTPVVMIGRIVEGKALKVLLDGEEVERLPGFDHFD